VVLLCSILVGVLAQGSWKLFEELEDPTLRKLVENLPATIMHSHADSTVQKYFRAYRRWKVWAMTDKFDPIPAKPEQFVLYLQYLGKETHSKSAIEEACNAIAWVHTTAGLVSTTAHPFVKATLEGLRRTLAEPVVKKEPVTIEMLEAVVQDANSSGRLSDLRLATAYLLGFAGFLRFDELINFRPCDIIIGVGMMDIKILRSKTATS